MEIMGAGAYNFDEEWESLGKLMFSNGDNINPNLVGFYDNESSFFPTNYHDDTFGTNFFHSVSQESSNSSEMDRAIFPIYKYGNYENNYQLQPNGVNFVEPVFPDNVMEEILQLKVETGSDHFCEEMQLVKRKYEGNYSPENPKKKSRVPRNAQKNKRGNKKVIEADNINDEEEKNGGFNKQSSSSCGISEEDDHPNNASQEILNGGRSTSESKGSASLNSNGKARASDPQSVYARRRRERINERLRTLQNLVPNGTKVDISTMLEEAVQYVKFLQLQIKLLSSDDLWMYAPIAYNGMDIGMYQKISPNLCSLQN